MRGAAACAAARLLRHAPQQLVVLISKFGARILVSGRRLVDKAWQHASEQSAKHHGLDASYSVPHL